MVTWGPDREGGLAEAAADPKTERDFVYFPWISRIFFAEEVERKYCECCQTISISVTILEQIAK